MGDRVAQISEVRVSEVIENTRVRSVNHEAEVRSVAHDTGVRSKTQDIEVRLVSQGTEVRLVTQGTEVRLVTQGTEVQSGIQDAGMRSVSQGTDVRSVAQGSEVQSGTQLSSDQAVQVVGVRGDSEWDNLLEVFSMHNVQDVYVNGAKVHGGSVHGAKGIVDPVHGMHEEVDELGVFVNSVHMAKVHGGSVHGAKVHTSQRLPMRELWGDRTEESDEMFGDNADEHLVCGERLDKWTKVKSKKAKTGTNVDTGSKRPNMYTTRSVTTKKK